MMKIKKKITNPMTVIAIFAVISETSATVTLPFLDNGEREIYIWFLISFPFYLIFLFFVTINFNYRSLYSPSDFNNEKNFLSAFQNNRTKNGSIPSSNKERGAANPGAQHKVRLSASVKTLHFIDIRQMVCTDCFGKAMETIRHTDKQAQRIIVFVSDHVSENSLKRHLLFHAERTKKGGGKTYCVSYNVCSQDVTVMGTF
ncbi:hypothetical protein [Pseudomonas atagonensis]|uniref:hypothetical protein n=1 Tax=Pseudomonas atagonensis TaxID=2609964 RepID=UPI00140DE51C|nr:hypothetical protein [Pseudomonas atagonensis]